MNLEQLRYEELTIEHNKQRGLIVDPYPATSPSLITRESLFGENSTISSKVDDDGDDHKETTVLHGDLISLSPGFVNCCQRFHMGENMYAVQPMYERLLGLKGLGKCYFV